MNDLVLFSNERFGNLRVFIKNEEPWFVAKDIADLLEYSKTSNMLDRLDEDDKIKLNYSDSVSLGLENVNSQGMYFINESGLYNAIFGSKKPEAKQFKKWVTSEVLPSIRKHGVYMTEDTIEKTLNDPDFIIKLATQLKEEKQKRLLIEQQLEDQKPKVQMYNDFMNSDSLLNFKQVADTLGCGRNSLMKVLREEKILSDGNFNKNHPYSQYIKAELFKVKITPMRTSNGLESICTTLCTAKSLEFIRKVLDKKRDLQLNLQVV